MIRASLPLASRARSRSVAPAQRAANAQATAGFRDSLQKHGMQINEVPDKAAFRRGVLPMYENFRGQIGADIIRDALAAVQ